MNLKNKNELIKKAGLYFHLICRFDSRYKAIEKESAISEIVTTILETDRAGFREQINACRRNLHKLYRCLKPTLIDWSLFTVTESYSDNELALAEKILSFYEDTDFISVCNRFELEGSGRLRKCLSELCPKPEKSNKQHGKHQKVYLSEKMLPMDIVEKYKINRITAWWASKRGYFYHVPTPSES